MYTKGSQMSFTFFLSTNLLFVVYHTLHEFVFKRNPQYPDVSFLDWDRPTQIFMKRFLFCRLVLTYY